MNENQKINKIHQLELKIALEIKRICDKYQIDYFLIAGTMLGAVRHAGFIPWDDDMDIGMLRCDYNKFIDVCKKELSRDYFLQTWDTDVEYPFSYAKIRLNGTKLVENFSKNSNAHQGIFVDVFPFDNVPKSKIKRKIQAKKIFIYKRLLWLHKGYGENIKHSKIYKIKFTISRVIAKSLPYKRIKMNMQEALTKYNDEVTDKIFTDGSYNYEKETIKKLWVKELTEIKFEDENFKSILHYDEYLTHFYGDYMTPPPKHKRGGHEIMEIYFGEY